MIESDRLITARSHTDEERQDRAIRPKKLADYVGQKELRAQMEIFIQAATARQEALDHVLILALPDWVKQHWPISSQPKCVLKFARLQALCWIRRAIWPHC